MAVVLRFVSLALIVIALVLLGADGVSSLQRGGPVTVHSMDQVWTLLGPASIARFKAWLAHSLPAPIPGSFYSVLALPAWAPPGVLGVVIAFLFARHQPQTV